jgi:hypothetical protein
MTEFPSIRPEPVYRDLPRFGQLFFEAMELNRRIELELEAATRQYGRGRRRELLAKSAETSLRLMRWLAPLASVERR